MALSSIQSTSVSSQTALLFVALVGLAQQTAGESFMETWLSQQAVKGQDWIAGTASDLFNADDWLAKQKAQKHGEFLAGNAASQEGETHSQESWAPAASWEAEDLERSLLSDIEKVLGEKHRLVMEGRIKAIETEMHPTFQALPKNEYNKLGHASVRYLLNRFFVSQHGWFIDGLFTEGDHRNMSSPAHALKDRVPMFVQGLFEKRLGGRGFGEHELAVMAAVVEDSVQQEAKAQLLLTYKALNVSVTANLAEYHPRVVSQIVEAYMSAFVLGTNVKSATGKKLLEQSSSMSLYYPTWSAAQEFFREIRLRHTKGLITIDFPVVSAIISEIVDTFGNFQGRQCQGLKQQLTQLEKKGSEGCVRLPDFYNKGLKNDINWLFLESPEYLHHVGVLDDASPQDPRLLSANYINSPSNCLQPSGYYLVCCHNECDDILGGLETQLAKASGTPAEILSALANAGPSIPAMGRSALSGAISPAIRFRLDQIAEYDGGVVPIHGRLFAQWLHHVFPHECPYPHLAGTKKQQWIDDFEYETGMEVRMSDSAMTSVVQKALNNTVANQAKTKNELSTTFGSCAPWQDEEELFAPLPSSMPLHKLEEDPHVWNACGIVAFLGAISAFMITLMRTFKSFSQLRRSSKMMHV